MTDQTTHRPCYYDACIRPFMHIGPHDAPGATSRLKAKPSAKSSGKASVEAGRDLVGKTISDLLGL